MKIVSFDAEQILDNKNVKAIIEIITQKEPKLPEPLIGHLKIYGVKNDSPLGSDFLLSYKVKDKTFPGYELSLFSISAISVGKVWEFFVSSPNNEDLLVKNIQDFPPIITDVFQQQKLDELLDEIYDLAASSQHENQKTSDSNEIRDLAAPPQYKNKKILKDNKTKGIDPRKFKTKNPFSHYPRYGNGAFVPAASIVASLKALNLPNSYDNVRLNIDDLIANGYELHVKEGAVEISSPTGNIYGRRKKRGQRKPYRRLKMNVANKRS